MYRKKKNEFSTLVVALVVLLEISFVRNVFCIENVKSNEHKRSSKIFKAAEALDLHTLKDDAIVVQELIFQKLFYRFSGMLAFSTENFGEIGQNVIVLDKREDHFALTQEKYVYTVMRKKSSTIYATVYYIFYAYYRSDIDFVEWDFYDFREFESPYQGLGVLDCSTTQMISCLEGTHPKSTAFIQELTLKQKMKVNSKYDYFLDLRDNAVESIILGLTNDIVVRVSKLLEDFQHQNESKTNFSLKGHSIAGKASVLGLLSLGKANFDNKMPDDFLLGDREAFEGRRFLWSLFNEMTPLLKHFFGTDLSSKEDEQKKSLETREGTGRLMPGSSTLTRHIDGRASPFELAFHAPWEELDDPIAEVEDITYLKLKGVDGRNFIGTQKFENVVDDKIKDTTGILKNDSIVSTAADERFINISNNSGINEYNTGKLLKNNPSTSNSSLGSSPEVTESKENSKTSSSMKQVLSPSLEIYMDRESHRSKRSLQPNKLRNKENDLEKLNEVVTSDMLVPSTWSAAHKTSGCTGIMDCLQKKSKADLQRNKIRTKRGWLMGHEARDDNAGCEGIFSIFSSLLGNCVGMIDNKESENENLSGVGLLAKAGYPVGGLVDQPLGRKPEDPAPAGSTSEYVKVDAPLRSPHEGAGLNLPPSSSPSRGTFSPFLTKRHVIPDSFVPNSRSKRITEFVDIETIPSLESDDINLVPDDCTGLSECSEKILKQKILNSLNWKQKSFETHGRTKREVGHSDTDAMPQTSNKVNGTNPFGVDLGKEDFHAYVPHLRRERKGLVLLPYFSLKSPNERGPVFLNQHQKNLSQSLSHTALNVIHKLVREPSSLNLKAIIKSSSKAFKQHIDDVIHTEASFFDSIGWETRTWQLSNLTESVRASEALLFWPTGHCKLAGSLEEMDKSTLSGLVNFYLATLRTHCQPNKSLKDAVKLKCLEKKNNTLSLSRKCPLLTKSKLSKEEWNILAIAFEISVYSSSYVSVEEGMKSYNPGGSYQSVSLSVLTLQETLSYARLLEPVVRPHYIKLMRNLLKVLKSIFVKHLQDYFWVTIHHECSQELKKKVRANVEIVYNTLQYAFLQFDIFNSQDSWHQLIEFVGKYKPNISNYALE